VKGEVVSAETSQTTESLRSGTWRDSWLTFPMWISIRRYKVMESKCCRLTEVGNLAGQIDTVDKDVAVGDLLCNGLLASLGVDEAG